MFELSHFRTSALPSSVKPITSMIKDRIGRHEVLSPINHNYERKKEKKFGGKENTTILVVRYEKKTSLGGTFP